MTDPTLRVGLVGAGNTTRRRHIPGFQKQPDVDLVAVANRTKASGERVAKEFGLARVYEDWRGPRPPPATGPPCVRGRPHLQPANTPPARRHRHHRPSRAALAPVVPRRAPHPRRAP